jgi:hypothetical protein
VKIHIDHTVEGIIGLGPEGVGLRASRITRMGECSKRSCLPRELLEKTK